MTIISDVRKIANTDVRNEVEKKLKLFSSYKNKPSGDWFSELCFCILTANSKAATAINIQNELGHIGFSCKPHEELSSCIRRNKHRFHNNKAKYIIEAREFMDIKGIVQNLFKKGGSLMAREWIAQNIKGLGMKEASHFLRNVGYFDLSILDRHILNLMAAEGIIKRPKSLSKKAYLEIEGMFLELAKKTKMSAAELDMYMWYIKTGKVLK